MCSLYSGVSLLHISIPFVMVRVFFDNKSRKQFNRAKTAIGQAQVTTNKLNFCHLLGQLDNWMTGQLDHWSCEFTFCYKQLNAPSIRKPLDIFSNVIQFILDQFFTFISALTLSPTIGAKLCCIWSTALDI